MKKDLLHNFKIELPQFATKLITELLLGIIIGSIPVWINSRSKEGFEATINGLLAVKQLSDHASFLLIPYTVICIYSFAFTRKTEWGARRFNYIHKITSEVGTNLLAIVRAGLGAMFGYLTASAFTEFGAKSNTEYVTTALYLVFTLIFCAAVSLFHDTLTPQKLTSRYKNDLKFDRNLK
ncbi:hypothetical protein SAMN03159512_04750 [Pseudomonas sp. NFR09]|uniref:hypothetical protein n=1 Tax=unclassified Pseudomonas TaxID=196821 RepID=UPI0008AEF341|nr:hypothetical protein [Pseudomonas sp. NFR09]SEU04579.1 hypothetical protein SAMN03159512_04750 [Pseudomonas sp. NFR09]